jgi:hypothetical protein
MSPRGRELLDGLDTTQANANGEIGYLLQSKRSEAHQTHFSTRQEKNNMSKSTVGARFSPAPSQPRLRPSRPLRR